MNNIEILEELYHNTYDNWRMIDKDFNEEEYFKLNSVLNALKWAIDCLKD